LIFLILGALVLKHPAFKKYVELRSEQWSLQAGTIKQLLYIGVPSALQMGMEVAAFSVSAIIIGMIDAVSLAAHQIAISCASFTFMVATGFAHGSSIRTSNALGRNDWRMISAVGKSALVTGLLWGGFCASSFVLFRYQLAKAFTDEESVIALASTLLLLAAFFQISDSVQAIGAGLLRGIKDVKYPTLMISIAYWIVGLPSGYIIAFHFEFGAAGMWLGFITGLSFSAFFLSVRFLKMTREYQSGV
jgi:MATE family multidrug resistance protein